MSGSFVPAEYASFRSVLYSLLQRHHCVLINEISVHDALLTRLSNDDDMEKSLSTFANEMASSAMILGIFFVSCMSLLLTDE